MIIEKDFDCVKMKNEIRAKIYAETKDMSSSERIAYFKASLQEDPFWQSLQKRQK